jgi:hypothetical protein
MKLNIYVLLFLLISSCSCLFGTNLSDSKIASDFLFTQISPMSSESLEIRNSFAYKNDKTLVYPINICFTASLNNLIKSINLLKSFSSKSYFFELTSFKIIDINVVSEFKVEMDLKFCKTKDLKLKNDRMFILAAKSLTPFLKLGIPEPRKDITISFFAINEKFMFHFTGYCKNKEKIHLIFERFLEQKWVKELHISSLIDKVKLYGANSIKFDLIGEYNVESKN